MNTHLFYIIATLLIITWAIRYIGYSTGGTMHVLLTIAVIALIIKFFRKEKFFKAFRN